MRERSRIISVEFVWLNKARVYLVAHEVFHRGCGGHFCGDGEQASGKLEWKRAEHWTCEEE